MLDVSYHGPPFLYRTLPYLSEKRLNSRLACLCCLTSEAVGTLVDPHDSSRSMDQMDTTTQATLAHCLGCGILALIPDALACPPNYLARRDPLMRWLQLKWPLLILCTYELLPAVDHGPSARLAKEMAGEGGS